MSLRIISGVVLVLLVAFGVWSGGKLSYQQYLSGEACPLLGPVPACYIAFVGYLMMAVALATLGFGFRSLNWVFWTGLAVAGGLALLGSAFELIRGNICPRAFGWLPMCYVSLAFSVLIGLLYASLYKTAAISGAEV